MKSDWSILLSMTGITGLVFPTENRRGNMCGIMGETEGGSKGLIMPSSTKQVKSPRSSRIPRLVPLNASSSKIKNNIQNPSTQKSNPVSPPVYNRKPFCENTCLYNNQYDCVYRTEYDNLAVGYFMRAEALPGREIPKSTPTYPNCLPAMHLDPLSQSENYQNPCLESIVASHPSNENQPFPPYQDLTPITELFPDCPEEILNNILDTENLFGDNSSVQNQQGVSDFNSQTSPLSELYRYLSDQQDNWNSYSVLPPVFSNEEMPPSSSLSFATSRSSLTGRGNKRSHSISPLSAELNAIIRSSPTSLVFLPGSRCSSNSLSPAPGEKPGCYGHLSARNSSGSNRSNSSTSSRRLSLPISQEESYLLPGSNNLCLLQQNGVLKKELYNASFKYLQPYSIPPPLSHLPPPPSYDQYMAGKNNKPLPHTEELENNQNSPKSVENTDKEQLKCNWIDCDEVFEERDDLVRHIETSHVDQRNFTCHWKGCFRDQRPFNARYKLLSHMRVHTGDKPNKCTFDGCNKAFPRKENLKIHLRSHTGERPYVCQYPECGKTFTNSSDRSKHVKTHQETKPYACQVAGCDKRYTDPSSLRKHVKNHVAKKEHTRKKLRGISDTESNFSDCLTVQPVRIFSIGEETSTSDPGIDSGIGRSPRGSQPGSSSDLYLGCQSSNVSPGSHRSNSPLGGINECREIYGLTSPKIPVLPPIGRTPVNQILHPADRPMSWCVAEDLMKYKGLLPPFNYQSPKVSVSNNCLVTPRKTLCNEQSRCQSIVASYNNFNPISLTFDVHPRQEQSF